MVTILFMALVGAAMSTQRGQLLLNAADNPTVQQKRHLPVGYSSTFKPRTALWNQTPAGPPVLPAKGAVETGVYRNMFVELGIPVEVSAPTLFPPANKKQQVGEI